MPLINGRSLKIYECRLTTDWRDFEEIAGVSTASGSTTSTGSAFNGRTVVQSISSLARARCAPARLTGRGILRCSSQLASCGRRLCVAFCEHCVDPGFQVGRNHRVWVSQVAELLAGVDESGIEGRAGGTGLKVSLDEVSG